MELDRFKTAWQEQPLEGAAARPLEDIMQDVHHRAVRFDRVIWRRDLLETLAGLFVIGMFGYFAWVIPSPIARVGAAIVMIGCLSIIARLYLSRNRHRASPDASAREFCAVELKRLEEQIRLLSTVGWWYLAPLLGGGAIFVLGLGGSAVGRVAMLALLLAVGVFIYRLNRTAVQQHLRPMRDHLAWTLEELAADESR
jgi:hypothetical protein